jgi:hypothetical protein
VALEGRYAYISIGALTGDTNRPPSGPTADVQRRKPLARGRLTRPWTDEPTTERAKTDAFGKQLFQGTAAIDKPIINRLTEVGAPGGCESSAGDVIHR